MVKSYLNKRSIDLEYCGEGITKPTLRGCVQGSIAGPTWWNLILDPLLCELEGTNVYSQAFVDDIVLVFSGSTAREIEESASGVMRIVQEWEKVIN